MQKIRYPKEVKTLKLKHRKKTVCGIATCLLLLILTVLIFPNKAFAANTEKILNSFPLKSNNLPDNILRGIGWAVVLFLHGLVKNLEGCIYSVNDAIGGFFTSSGVKELNKKVLALAVALMLLLILFIGLLSMIKPVKFTSIISNSIIGIVIALAIPSLLTSAYTLTNQAISYINADDSGVASENKIVSDRILVENITDTTRYDAENFESTDLKYKNSFVMTGTDTRITKIDPNELVSPDKMKHSEVWKNKVSTDSDGKETLVELGSGQLGIINIPIFSQYYYRWNIDWAVILTTLIVSAVALILSGIKIARLLYELAFHQTMTQVIALFDIFTAQRLKKCLHMLISTFVTLFSVSFMLQLYILGMTYLSGIKNIPIYVRIIVSIALAFAVIDGPNLFAQIFGIDVGVQSAVRTLYGLKAAGSMVAGGVALAGGRAALDSIKSRGVIGSAKSVLSGAGRAAGTVGGVAAGVASGAAANHSRVSAVKQGFSSAKNSSDAQNSGNNSSENKQSNKASVNSNPASAPINQSHNATNAAVSDKEKSVPTPNPIPGQPQEQQTNENIENKTEIPKSNDSNQTDKKNNTSTPKTMGGAFHSKVSNGIRNTGAVSSAQHMYSLTRGSKQKRGDKLVNREQHAQTILQKNPNLSHHQAIKDAKKEIKNEKKNSNKQDPSAASWAEQELNKEKAENKGDKS
jgi:hypothetical protein